MSAPQLITPCLWFDFKAEEAVAHYLSIFKDSKIDSDQPVARDRSTVAKRDAGSRRTRAAIASPSFANMGSSRLVQSFRARAQRAAHEVPN